jgi:hypothetical protein
MEPERSGYRFSPLAKKAKKRVPEPEKSWVPENDLNDALPVNRPGYARRC